MAGEKTPKKTKAQKEKLRLKRQKKRAETDPNMAGFVKFAGFPDRRAMEGAIADLFHIGSTGRPAEAQDLMYDAWDTPDPRERVRLAKAALEISRDCADAYVLLAEETAHADNEALFLYRQGVEAGERALGKEIFENCVGHFWGILETRPYMRARQGLAECLWHGGQREEAVAHWLDMLRLNPNDNQGVRYTLVPKLLELGHDEAAAALLTKYEESFFATWAYSAAILAYRRQGDSAEARALLARAFKSNPHVPLFLLGKKKIPRELPEYMSFGDENEAIEYAVKSRNVWKMTPGALDWLAAQFTRVS